METQVRGLADVFHWPPLPISGRGEPHQRRPRPALKATESPKTFNAEPMKFQKQTVWEMSEWRGITHSKDGIAVVFVKIKAERCVTYAYLEVCRSGTEQSWVGWRLAKRAIDYHVRIMAPSGMGPIRAYCGFVAEALFARNLWSS